MDRISYIIRSKIYISLPSGRCTTFGGPDNSSLTQNSLGLFFYSCARHKILLIFLRQKPRSWYVWKLIEITRPSYNVRTSKMENRTFGLIDKLRLTWIVNPRVLNKVFGRSHSWPMGNGYHFYSVSCLP